MDGCPKLRAFSLQADKSKLTNFKSFGKLKELEFFQMNISNAVIDDDTVIHWLTQWKEVKVIYLSGRHITDKTLEAMASIGCKLEIFDMLNWCGITDQGLEHLAKIKTISKIRMHYPHNFISVTANGIVKLAKHLIKLEELSVTVHSKHPLKIQMEEISSRWKGECPIRVYTIMPI